MRTRYQAALTILILTLISLIAVTGCSGTGHVETFGAGVATGSVLSNTFDGAQADLDKRQAQLIAARSGILDQMEQANSDAEKTVLQAKVDALEKKIEQTVSLQSGVKLAGDAMNTDWTDPQATAPWISTGIMTLLLALRERKNFTISKVLTAYQEGVEKFKAQSEPATAEKLYADIKNRKKLNGVK